MASFRSKTHTLDAAPGEPAGASAGDDLILTALTAVAGTPVAPTGWSVIGTWTGTNGKVAVWWRKRGNSAPTYTWTGGSGFTESSVLCYQGRTSSVIPPFVVSAAHQINPQNPNCPAALAAPEGSIVIAVATSWTGSVTSVWAPPTGYTIREDGVTVGNDLMSAEKRLTVAGVEDPGAFSNGSATLNDVTEATITLLPNNEPAPAMPKQLWGALSRFGKRVLGAIPGATTSVLSATLGQPEEIDLAQPITWAPKIRIPGQTSETDLAQPINRLKTKAIGQPSETDLAQPINRLKTRLLGQPSETDLAQPIARSKLKLLGQPSEADLAQPINRIKTKLLGQPSETDLAQPMGKSKLKLLGQPSETDLAQPITRLTSGLSATVNQASETDLAQPITWAPKIRIVGQAIETDTAGIVTVLQAGAVPDAINDGSGLRFTRRFAKHYENQSRLYNEYLDRVAAQRDRSTRPAPTPVSRPLSETPSTAVSERALSALDTALAQGISARENAEMEALAAIIADDDEMLLMID